MTRGTVAASPTPARAALGRLARGPAAAVLLMLPALVFLAVFFVYPVADLLLKSLTEFIAPQQAGLDNFRWFFDSSVNLVVLRRSVATALEVTAVCVIVGWPYAYLMTIVGRRIRAILLGVVVASFLTSLLVRSYAWLLLVERSGPLSAATSALGLGRIDLAGTTTAVVIALGQILVPLMILPLYANLRATDQRLGLAARSLGARPITVLARVQLPLSLPGLLAGALMIWVLTLGFYVTPTLVGSPQNAQLSQLVMTQITELLAFGRAGAMSIVLLALVLVMLGAVGWVSRAWLRNAAGQRSSSGPVESAWPPRRRAAWIAFGVLAVAWLVVPSLTVIPISFAGRPSFAFPPHGFSTQWYSNLLSDPQWSGAIQNTFEVGVLATALSVFLGTLAAIGMARAGGALDRLGNVVFVTPIMVPLVVSGIAVYALFLRWHLVGTIAGFVFAHTLIALPFVIVSVRSALQTIDWRLETAAASLGAGPIDRFFSVILPLIRPAVLSAAFIAFALSFDETAISLFIARPELSTLPVQIYQGVSRTTDPTAAAAATVTFLVTVAIAIGYGATQREERDVATA